jgi:branched-chain amino acid transport system permease protein
MFFQQILANSLITASVYGLLAIGFNLIYGTVRFFDLSFAAIPVIGAYMVFLFAKMLHLPLWLAVIMGVVIGSLVSYGVYRLVYVPLRTRKASKMVFLVAALGLYTVAISLIPIFFTSQFQTLSNLINIKTITIGSAIITNVQATLIILFAIIGFTTAIILKMSRTGKAIRAVADDEEVTKTMGINTQAIIGKVFIAGGAIAALTGILVGFDTGMEPNMGFGLILKAVIACIIGGVGNIYAGIIGAIFLAVIENVGVWYFSAEWKDLIAFTVLIIFLLVRPQGLFKK